MILTGRPASSSHERMLDKSSLLDLEVGFSPSVQVWWSIPGQVFIHVPTTLLRKLCETASRDLSAVNSDPRWLEVDTGPAACVTIRKASVKER